MGNKSKKPGKSLNGESLVGEKWRKFRGRDPAKMRDPGSEWRGLQVETVSRGGFDIDQIIGRFRKVARAPLKVRDAGR